jgi:CheY-like chemotaxis protein
MEIVQAENAEMALAAMRGQLEKRKAVAAAAAAAAAAAGASEGGQPTTVDVILLDEHMQSSGGLLKGSEAIAHFRRLARSHDCEQPFIVINSGNCTADDVKGYIAMGADAVWPKPYPASAQMTADIAGWIRSTAGLS